MMRRFLKIGGLLFLVVAVFGALVVFSGIVPISASSGHWPITSAFLKFSMHRSISTHSLLINVPPLDDPRRVLQGAMHYDIACRSCHGSPGFRHPVIAHQMTPRPPYLPPRADEWKARELFYVVKHGVKFTGMPAWPTQNRDDEIWAMVAFLQKFSALDEDAYNQLTQGDPTAPDGNPIPTPPTSQGLADGCARCHGRERNAFPELAGQRLEYLKKSLIAYAAGERHSGTMQPIAAGLDTATIHELALYYSELGRDEAPRVDSADTAQRERGRLIAHRGIPAQRVPSCVDCHDAEGRRRKPSYPLLAGQSADYLVLQLQLFKKDLRGGSESAHLMQAVAPRLTEQQMRAVAHYFESLPLHRRDP